MASNEQEPMDLETELWNDIVGEDSEQQAEAAPEGTTDEPVEPEQPEATEESTEEQAQLEQEEAAPEGTTEPDAEEAPEQEADEDSLDDLKGEDGNFDPEKIKKAKKSLREAQKLVGKTAKDREEIKKAQAALQNAEQAIQTQRQWDEFLSRRRDVAEYIAKEIRIERGLEAPPTPQAKPETVPDDKELQAQADALWQSGKRLEAIRLVASSSPEVRGAMQAKAELERERKAAREAAAQAEIQAKIDREYFEFKQRYTGTLFDASGKVADTELMQAIQDVQRGVGFHLPFEDALAIAEKRLNRVQKPAAKAPPAKKPDAAKRQAAAVPKGAKPPSTVKPQVVLNDLTDEDLVRELELNIKL